MHHAGGRGKGGDGHGDHAADGNLCATATSSRADGHTDGGADGTCKGDSPEARYFEFRSRADAKVRSTDAGSEDYQNLLYKTESEVKGREKREQMQVVSKICLDDRKDGSTACDDARGSCS